MNDILKAKKRKQPISFKNFSSAEKVRLKTAYPFLSPGQINGKVKENWKLMEQKERLSYIKTELKFGKSNGNSSKLHKGSGIKQKKEKLQVCDTPEQVNLYKLSDFRKQHTASYQNDFEFDDSNSLTAHSSQNSDGENMLSGNRAEASVDMDPDVYEDFDSDEEEDGVLIRRTDLHDSSNDKENGIVGMETDNFDIEHGGDELKTLSDNTPIYNQIQTKESSSNGKGKRNVREADQVVNKESITSGGNDCEEELLFKSPNPKKSASKLGSNGRKKRQDAPAKLETPTSNQKQSVLTPQIGNNSEEVDKYTTPQMDEVLQKLTIHEVNKAPQKRRQSYKNSNQTETIKAIVSGRRVTRSLLAVQSGSGEDSDARNDSDAMKFSENEGVNIKKNERRNSKLSLRNKKKSEMKDENVEKLVGVEVDKIEDVEMKVKNSVKDKKTEPVDINNNSTMLEENRIQMNPSGAASQVDHESLDGAEEIQTQLIDSNRGDGKKGLKRKLKKPETSHSAMTQKSEKSKMAKRRKMCTLASMSPASSNHSKALESPSSVEFESSQASSVTSSRSSLRSLSPLRKSYRNKDVSNPALEKVLQSLRCTRVTSPSWSCGNSSVSSPRLLSPALSGVSELSSLSSQSDQKDESNNDNAFINSKKTVKENDLCDMFKDVTPPERKTKGLYKTSRMLNSGKEEEPNQFKQLFQADQDDIFF